MTTRRVRKTKLMRAVEEKFQRPLERLLRDTVNLQGLSHAPSELGVSTSATSYRMLKLGISYRRVAVMAQETIAAKRPG